MKTPISISRTLIICLTLVFSAFLQSSLSELCHPKDKKALLHIKKAFNKPNILASWDPDTDCCEWCCVKCDGETHRVISLNVKSGDLSGHISHHVGKLHYLETLDFQKNPNLTGSIPHSISRLKTLRFLVLSWNGILGHIPNIFPKLTNLELISLSHNSLTGRIPSSIGELQNLTELRLDGNKLTGPIPDSFGNFKGDDFALYLNGNQLSGEIPTSVGKKNFSYIDLSRNNLEGDASVLFGSNKTTWHLDISRNLFQFDFSNVKFAKNMLYLDISHNKISGRLPEGLAMLNLQQFNASYNRLCGKIPQGGFLQWFNVWAYVGNSCLCDPPLPSCDLVTAM